MNQTASAARPQSVPVLQLLATLIRHRRLQFIATSLLWTGVHALPVLAGLAVRALFDSLSSSAPAGHSPWVYLLLLVSVDLTRLGLLGGGIRLFSSYWLQTTLQLRRNLLSWLLEAPGARRLPDSPSEAVSRFRDDVDDIAGYIEQWIDLWGLLVFAVVSLSVMLSTNALLTLLIMIPSLLSILVITLLQPVIRRVRRRQRAAASRVTDFIGEMMGSVQAIRIAGREDTAMRHFDRLNEVRRKEAIRDSLLTEILRSVSSNMASVAVGIMLLLAARLVRQDQFTVGDFALFLAYLPFLTNVMTFLGNMLVQHRRTGVAFERLQRLLVNAPADAIVRGGDLGLRGEAPAFSSIRPERSPLDTLSVSNLSYRFPDGSAGIENVSFTLRRGSLTVITGRIGAGKTTLLRVLLGLLPADSGEIRWNGRLIQDPAAFFVPPHTAYTSQVPRLFSDSLRENLLLGETDQGGAIDRALDLAVFSQDVTTLEEGLDTQVGSRGVKLSGGQVQRSAAARMFLRNAELLVFDDLSSALDVETEARLWDRVFAQGDATCLVISHRRAALERADQVLELVDGRLKT
jgi:ABC-type multidrug transport system fused ATPase/permease subunit